MIVPTVAAARTPLRNITNIRNQTIVKSKLKVANSQQQQQQQTQTNNDDEDNSILVPVLVFAGIVGAAAVYTFTREGEELQFIVSPNR